MIAVFTYILCFACGFLAKATDSIADCEFSLKLPRIRFAAGAAYGLLAGFLATQSRELATLIIAITVGVLLSGKIDEKAHQLAIAVLLLAVAFIGLPQVNVHLLLLFLLLGFIDETGNDLADAKEQQKKRFPRPIAKILKARPCLELGALAVGIALNNWVYFLAVLSFDAAYNIAPKAMQFFSRRRKGLVNECSHVKNRRMNSTA